MVADAILHRSVCGRGTQFDFVAMMHTNLQTAPPSTWQNNTWVMGVEKEYSAQRHLETKCRLNGYACRLTDSNQQPEGGAALAGWALVNLRI